MKKITFLLLFFLITGYTCRAQFPQTFTANTLPTGWIKFDNGIGTTYSWTLPSAGGYVYCRYETLSSATLSSLDWLVTPQFTVDATNYILSFSQADAYSDDYFSIYTVRVSTATQNTASDFTIVDTQTEAAMTHQSFSTHYVDLSAYIGQSIYVAFVLEQNDGDYWYIDNVNMIPDATAPGPVSTPTPVDLATNVSIDNSAGDMAVAFSWTAATTGGTPTSYKFYLGDSANNLTLLGATSNTSVNVTGMAYNTAYYWQVVASNVGGDATGSSVWSFNTQMDPLSTQDFKNNLFSVYPNPATDIINIKSDVAITGAELYNQLGQKVMDASASEITDNTMNISHLVKGVYILKLYSETSSQSIKITKE